MNIRSRGNYCYLTKILFYENLGQFRNMDRWVIPGRIRILWRIHVRDWRASVIGVHRGEFIRIFITLNFDYDYVCVSTIMQLVIIQSGCAEREFIFKTVKLFLNF